MATTLPAEGNALGAPGLELERLVEQSQFFGELTEDVLRRAGVGRGMRVLDAGCGWGEVSFLAASLVGEVAERVGYRSASTFSTAFSRHVGQPPSRYARQP